MEILKNDWKDVLDSQFRQEYYQHLREFLKSEYANKMIHPPMHDIFNALHYTSYKDTKVVLLGQDPYHGVDQAHGFSFSVNPGVAIPPSLRNIYKELKEDVEITPPNHGHLLHWAEQGVLLLNTVLTVREGQAHSHKGKGWEKFTNAVIEAINQRESPVVFLLWGKPAQQKMNMIDTTKHLCLTAPHPSPLSAYRGFFGSHHFSRTNEFLVRQGLDPIDWQLPHDPYSS
ncbi:MULTISPECIES: uracil-DNA glycosylase [Pontibacillus]|uniref:Uracil-DNA glycosylase n=1 Tax=Pontibacillus chungwhensis TaxID=265426 RepID=A0ABY8UXE8_9BACI|nr:MULTISPECIES: uracil-DNA glycosylase [Pontibacillus]MCD5322915.1 uracil-DNA glycosylase [Pontibacillus sp. HN14]WIF96311.1 uracil-DNA glycosylase [Pontibacillus chungwhensis]